MSYRKIYTKLSDRRGRAPGARRATAMESNSPTTSLCLHRDVCVNLEPLHPSSIVQLQLPSSSAFSRQSRVVRKVASSLPASRNENDFKRRHVASASSMYFRRSKSFPRNILWRLLDDSTVLELRSVDLSKAASEMKEASLTLRLQFPTAIQENGVALAGTEEDILLVFVVTRSHELYTFSLRSGFFCRPNASEESFERWCKVSKPILLAGGTLYRFTAPSPLELLITFADGRLLRLVRRQGDDGSDWSELQYNETHWSVSLRSWARWQEKNTVRFDGVEFDRNAALAASFSPDKQHIVTVCLNHTLRFWSLASSKPTVVKDLLDVERDPNAAQKLTLNPGTPKTLEVFEAQTIRDGDVYYAMTYSPHSNGLFKIWAIRDADHGEHGVRSLFPEYVLRAPDPDDGALWTVFDFKVRSTPGSDGIDVWIFVRLNRRCRLYFREFPDFQNLGVDWDAGWSVTSIDENQAPFGDPPLSMTSLDLDSVSDKWLEFLFMPGWIPEAVLETALHVFASSQQTQVPNSKHSLKEKMVACIGSRIYLSHSDGSFDPYERMCEEANAEWTNLWQCVLEIEKARSEPMSLGFDALMEMPWIVLADGICTLRDCSEIELLSLNSTDALSGYQSRAILPSVESDAIPSPTISQDELCTFIGAATSFRSSFSQALQLTCQNAVDCELWLDSGYRESTRIQSFYDQCNFYEEISDQQYDDLEVSLDAIGGIDGLTTARFMSVIDLFSSRMSKGSGLHTTKFGLRATTRGLQDTISLNSQILQDLMILTVFIEVDTNQGQEPLKDFDASHIFAELIEPLRQAELAKWLASNTQVVVGLSKPDASDSKTLSPETPTPQPTIIEALFAKDIRPHSRDSQSESAAFTQTVRDVLTWMAGAGEITLNNVLVNIQCGFIRNGSVDLASSFARFQPLTAWATYIRGRLCLLQHDLTEAAICFNKAATKLSQPKPSSQKYAEASSSLLDPMTASLLASGLANYNTHIADLFAPLRAHTHIVKFAKQALEHDPPPAQRSDLLARLFHSSLALADYATAYDALSRYTDRSLQRAALVSLIADMRDASCVQELLALPFEKLARDVDALLAERARTETHLEPSTGAGEPVPYFKVLYALRLQRGDTRGAAAVLVQRLESRRERRAKAAKNGVLASASTARGAAEKARDEYLVGINALALCGTEDEEGWVFVEGEDEEGGPGGSRKRKRRVVRLTDLREVYQKEMDRMAMLDVGRYGIMGMDGDDEMEEDNRSADPRLSITDGLRGGTNGFKDTVTKGGDVFS